MRLSAHSCRLYLTPIADRQILIKEDVIMSNIRACAFSSLAVAITLALSANAQTVISTHAGLIHFFEGPVYLGDQPLESHLGRFPYVSPGVILRTEEGRAEVLLTPGVFLRLGQRSAIRMLTSDLADTQVELLGGSAVVDSGPPNSDTSVTLIYKNWRVHFLEEGHYRIDSDPPRLVVKQGEAEVSAGPGGRRVAVHPWTSLPFADVLVTEPSSMEPADSLRDWANGRNASISADNSITAQIDEDPASGVPGMPGLDGFTYFPFLGLSYPGASSSSMYSSLTYQPGFNSVYLPGYTYMPLLLGLGGRRIPIYGTSSPGRIGLLPRPGITTTPVPRAPILRPAPVRAPAPVPVRGIGHR
jgi:hypothetical protein